MRSQAVVFMFRKDRENETDYLQCIRCDWFSNRIFFGGWDAGLTTLLIFMGLDYISGLIVAGVFKNSPKTDTGSLESKAGWKGLCRKCMTLIFVLVAYRLDLVIGTNYIRDAVIIAFIANETISLWKMRVLWGYHSRQLSPRLLIFYRKKTESEGK